MKVADTKTIKAVKGFLSKIVSKYSELRFSANNTLKNRDQKTGSLNFNIKVSPEEFPDILDKDDYLELIKKMLKDQFKKDVRYLNINWSCTDLEDSCCDSCCISFDMKLS
jgi:hypothetical protein